MQTHSSHLPIVSACFLTLLVLIAVFAALPSQKPDPESEAKPEADPEAQAKHDFSISDEELESLIEEAWQNSFPEFEADLWEAYQAYRQNLGNAYGRMRRAIVTIGEAFSDDRLNRRNLLNLARMMAQDKVGSGERADRWLEEHLLEDLNRILIVYREDLDRETAVFERRVEEAMATFRRRFANAVEEISLQQPENPRLGEITYALQESMRSQSIQSAVIVGLGIGLGVTLDIVAIRSNFRYGMNLVSNMKISVFRVMAPIVGRTAARATASGAIAWAPPVALTVAGIGTAWTGYDIYRMRDRAREDFMDALKDSLGGQRRHLENEVLNPVRGQLETFIKRLRENEETIRQELIASATHSPSGM